MERRSLDLTLKIGILFKVILMTTHVAWAVQADDLGTSLLVAYTEGRFPVENVTESITNPCKEKRGTGKQC